MAPRIEDALIAVLDGIIRPDDEEPVGHANETISSSEYFPGMAEICLDRFLKQRFALRILDISFDFPPPSGGLRSLSVGADCVATKSRALSALLS
jgi:hypothetical protein